MHYKMHSTNISTLETVFVIVHFVSEIFSSLAAAVFHLRLVAGGVWGLVCQLVMWLLGMGDCLNPVPWAPADQMLNGLGKMIGKCCASLRSHSELLGNPSPSTNIRGPFIFSQTGFSSLTQAAKEGEEWSRESPYQPGKMDFLSTIAPVPVTLFSSIWLQNCPWISHGTKELNIYQVSPAPNLKMSL